nr:hypothetical protein [Tanacetum cinerariifolium]
MSLATTHRYTPLPRAADPRYHHHVTVATSPPLPPTLPHYPAAPSPSPTPPTPLRCLSTAGTTTTQPTPPPLPYGSRLNTEPQNHRTAVPLPAAPKGV